MTKHSLYSILSFRHELCRYAAYFTLHRKTQNAGKETLRCTQENILSYFHTFTTSFRRVYANYDFQLKEEAYAIFCFKDIFFLTCLTISFHYQ